MCTSLYIFCTAFVMVSFFKFSTVMKSYAKVKLFLVTTMWESGGLVSHLLNLGSCRR